MAYIIGIVTEDEEAELERRGWELEKASDALIQALNYGAEASKDKFRVCRIFDVSMFDVMDGPDWEKGG